LPRRRVPEPGPGAAAGAGGGPPAVRAHADAGVGPPRRPAAGRPGEILAPRIDIPYGQGVAGPAGEPPAVAADVKGFSREAQQITARPRAPEPAGPVPGSAHQQVAVRG